MAPKTKPAKPKTEKKPKKDDKPNKCGCGCGTKVRNNFAQGHDAKLHSKLLEKVRAGGAGAAGAKKELRAHKWAVPTK